MSENPLVTVVMPTWNRMPFVEEAAKSVIAQTYQHWELIVIDDGSTDGTAERLSALKDSRIRVLSGPHAGRIGRLRNRGVAAGTGELIAFLDSDDLWMPRKLEVQLRALRESGAGWSYSCFEMMDAEGREIPLPKDGIHILSGDIVPDMLTFHATVRTPTVVVRRVVFDAAGGYSDDPRLLVGEDYELYMRFAVRSRAVGVPDVLARIREHAGRTTARGSHDPYELKPLLYELFIASAPGASHARAARRLWARSLADAGAQQLSAGKLDRAIRLFGGAARRGADVDYWLRALARGVRNCIFRRRHPSVRGKQPP